MQKGRGHAAGHAIVAVRRARGAAFEEAQDAAHLRMVVERGDEMHLGGAGVGETDLNARGEKGFHQRLRAVHLSPHGLTGPVWPHGAGEARSAVQEKPVMGLPIAHEVGAGAVGQAKCLRVVKINAEKRGHLPCFVRQTVGLFAAEGAFDAIGGE